jgi:hypothetical protein
LSHQILVSKNSTVLSLNILYFKYHYQWKASRCGCYKKCIPHTENLLTTYHNVSSSESFSKNEHKTPNTIFTHTIKKLHHFYFKNCFMTITWKTASTFDLTPTIEVTFDVHVSANCWCIFKYNQQDATLHNVFMSVKCCTCFRQVLCPSSRAQNCIYSIGYLSSR